MKKLKNDLGHLPEDFIMERGEKIVEEIDGKKTLKRKKLDKTKKLKATKEKEQEKTKEETQSEKLK